ncbi:unnamed protein product [Amoebophrya sp. A25]|nr:unnamed protein product [Amoebophrya sp. A25]|eukprot:GSA25T00010241001.1
MPSSSSFFSAEVSRVPDERNDHDQRIANNDEYEMSSRTKKSKKASKQRQQDRNYIQPIRSSSYRNDQHDEEIGRRWSTIPLVGEVVPLSVSGGTARFYRVRNTLEANSNSCNYFPEEGINPNANLSRTSWILKDLQHAREEAAFYERLRHRISGILSTTSQGREGHQIRVVVVSEVLEGGRRSRRRDRRFAKFLDTYFCTCPGTISLDLGSHLGPKEHREQAGRKPGSGSRNVAGQDHEPGPRVGDQNTSSLEQGDVVASAGVGDQNTSSMEQGDVVAPAGVEAYHEEAADVLSSTTTGTRIMYLGPREATTWLSRAGPSTRQVHDTALFGSTFSFSSNISGSGQRGRYSVPSSCPPTHGRQRDCDEAKPGSLTEDLTLSHDTVGSLSFSTKSLPAQATSSTTPEGGREPLAAETGKRISMKEPKTGNVKGAFMSAQDRSSSSTGRTASCVVLPRHMPNPTPAPIPASSAKTTTPSHDFLVLSDMYGGFSRLRFADLKLGKATAVANWMGKSAFRAWRNHQVDRLTNSVHEGFRVEGLDFPPAALSQDYTAVANSSLWASLLGNAKKVNRMTLQRLSGMKFWRLFLEIDHDQAEIDNARKSTERQNVIYEASLSTSEPSNTRRAVNGDDATILIAGGTASASTRGHGSKPVFSSAPPAFGSHHLDDDSASKAEVENVSQAVFRRSSSVPLVCEYQSNLTPDRPEEQSLGHRVTRAAKLPGGASTNLLSSPQPALEVSTTAEHELVRPRNDEADSMIKERVMSMDGHPHGSDAVVDPRPAALLSSRRKELYSRYVMLAVLVKLTKLIDGLCQIDYPQMWVGSSLGIGFELEAAKSSAIMLRQPGSRKMRSDHSNVEGGGDSCLQSTDVDHEDLESRTRDPVVVKVFDWGRSEWNTAENHALLKPEDRGLRVEHWRGYLQSIVRLLFQGARLFLHRFGCPAWRSVVVELLEFHSMHHEDRVVKAAIEIPLFPLGVDPAYYGISVQPVEEEGDEEWNYDGSTHSSRSRTRRGISRRSVSSRTTTRTSSSTITSYRSDSNDQDNAVEIEEDPRDEFGKSTPKNHSRNLSRRKKKTRTASSGGSGGSSTVRRKRNKSKRSRSTSLEVFFAKKGGGSRRGERDSISSRRDVFENACSLSRPKKMTQSKTRSSRPAPAVERESSIFVLTDSTSGTTSPSIQSCSPRTRPCVRKEQRQENIQRKRERLYREEKRQEILAYFSGTRSALQTGVEYVVPLKTVPGVFVPRLEKLAAEVAKSRQKPRHTPPDETQEPGASTFSGAASTTRKRLDINVLYPTKHKKDASTTDEQRSEGGVPRTKDDGRHRRRHGDGCEKENIGTTRGNQHEILPKANSAIERSSCEDTSALSDEVPGLSRTASASAATTSIKEPARSLHQETPLVEDEFTVGFVTLVFHILTPQRISVEIRGFSTSDRRLLRSGNANLTVLAFEDSRDAFAHLYNTFCGGSGSGGAGVPVAVAAEADDASTAAAAAVASSSSSRKDRSITGREKSSVQRVAAGSSQVRTQGAERSARGSSKKSRKTASTVASVSAPDSSSPGVATTSTTAMVSLRGRVTEQSTGLLVPREQCSTQADNDPKTSKSSEQKKLKISHPSSTSSDRSDPAQRRKGATSKKDARSNKGESPSSATRAPFSRSSPHHKIMSTEQEKDVEPDSVVSIAGATSDHIGEDTTTAADAEQVEAFSLKNKTQKNIDPGRTVVAASSASSSTTKTTTTGGTWSSLLRGRNYGTPQTQEDPVVKMYDFRCNRAAHFEFLGIENGERQLVTALNLPPEILAPSSTGVAASRTSPLLKVFPSPVVPDGREEVKVNNEWFGRQITARYFSPAFLYAGKGVPTHWL